MELNEVVAIKIRLEESLAIINDDLLNYDWRHLANHGLTLPAIKSYRKQHGGGLHESKMIVDDFIASNKKQIVLNKV